MSGRQEKIARKLEKEAMLERALEAQKLKDEMESKKVEIQTYYFADTKGQRYPITQDIYEGLKARVEKNGKEEVNGSFEFGFVDHMKDPEKWAKVTFPLADVWYVLTVFEKILPIEEVKKIEALGASVEE